MFYRAKLRIPFSITKLSEYLQSLGTNKQDSFAFSNHNVAITSFSFASLLL